MQMVKIYLGGICVCLQVKILSFNSFLLQRKTIYTLVKTKVYFLFKKKKKKKKKIMSLILYTNQYDWLEEKKIKF